MGAERRRAPRYQFVADAELVETATGAKSRGKTGDLSLGGCFLDTMNPAPEGTELAVTISREDRRFSALGRVVFQFPRFGMGVVFTHIGSDHLAILEEWLSEAERTRSVGPVIGAALGEDEKS